MSENYQEETVEENSLPDETQSEELTPSKTTDPNGKYARYAIFGLAILFILVLLIVNLFPAHNNRLSPELTQKRTQQVAEIKNTSAVIIELVSDDRYPELERSISETPLPVYDYNLISPENPTGLVEAVEEELTEPEPEFFEPSMTFRAKIKVPDLEKVAQLDLSENTRIDIPQKEQEIVLKVDLYTKVHNGTLDDLAPDTIIQASFAKSVLSDQETHYAREITILK